MIKNIREILILVLILFIGYQFMFPVETIIEKPIIETITTTDTLFVDIVTKDTVYVPKIFTKRDTVMVPAIVDTVSIISDYFSEYTYSDTLTVDSLGYGYLKDVIFMNRITSRSVRWDYRIPVITNTIETTITLPPKREFQFYLGGIVGGDKTTINYFGPAVGFKTKGDKFFSVGAGIMGSNNVGVTFSAYYRFRPFR